MRYVDPNNPKKNRYSKAFKKRFLDLFTEHKDVPKVCELMEIERDTFYTWMRHDKRYAKQFFAIQHEAFENAKVTVLDTYAECGSILRACKICGMSQSAFYSWLISDPEYKAAYIVAKELVRDSLEHKAVEMALGGDKDMLKFLLNHIYRADHLRVTANQSRPYEVEDAEFRPISDFEDIINRLAEPSTVGNRTVSRQDGSLLSAEISTES